MNYQLSAPANLLPALATRLALSAPTLSYSLCTPQILPSAEMPHLILQPDFFHPPSTASSGIEVFLIPSPLAPIQGYIVAAAGDQPNLAQCAPILDALAPMPAGWLHVGDIGAASFLHQLWLVVTNSQQDGPLPFWQNMRQSDIGFGLDQPDLITQLSSLMAQQQLITHSLMAVAQDFLSRYPITQPFSPYNPQQAKFLTQDKQDQSSPAHQIANLLCSFEIKK